VMAHARVQRLMGQLTPSLSLPSLTHSGSVASLTPASPFPFVNPVKKKLQDGQIVLAGTVTTSNVDSAVVMAQNFDLLWLEGEHSPVTLESMRNIIMATRGMRAVPFTRVPVNALWTAKRMLDIGSLGVIFPFTSTPELARQAVDACRYPPIGKRGSGTGLVTLRWTPQETGAGGYHQWANSEVMCVIIIEQKEAVEAIDEIAATPGIDLLFVGTSDLSFSYGGSEAALSSPEVQSALRRVCVAAKRNGVACGCPAGNAKQMQTYIDMGFRFFQAASDVGFLQSATRGWVDSIRSAGINVAPPATAVATTTPKPLY